MPLLFQCLVSIKVYHIEPSVIPSNHYVNEVVLCTVSSSLPPLVRVTTTFLYSNMSSTLIYKCMFKYHRGHRGQNVYFSATVMASIPR